MNTIRLSIIASAMLITTLFVRCASSSNAKREKATAIQYQCLPCGYDCDTILFNGPGKCPHCKMALVNKATVGFISIQPDDICDYIASHPKTVLLDVRTKEEFEGKRNPDFGTLKNALNIPVQNLQERISELQGYKSSEIIVYCSHSHRSRQAAYLLNQNGFGKVINMAGGMSELKDSACKK